MNKKTLLLLPMLSFILTVHAQLTDSNLPIVIITTDNGATIPDEPGVLGNMKIINRGPGLRNYVTDQDSLQFLNYNGRIDIELRGSYSQSFPKKAYGFTTLKPTNDTVNNVCLLGMPKENDWILNALSSDPSLIRDYLSYNLSRQIGQYASRTVYCEVMVNGDYRGLYLLEEKIKADKDRVNIHKIDTPDNSLPELSGGYITKTDKTTGNDPIAWYMSSLYGYNDCQFIHSWPKPQDVTTQQNNYIKSVFLNLQSVCAANNASLSNGFPSIIDIPSFVDYILINEIASNTDAYCYSTYYHKDRKGKLRAGPAWDMNLTFGNDLFEFGVDRSKPDIWQFADYSIEGPKYYRDLFNNVQFKCYLSKRWNELIQPGQPFNLASLESYIDTTVAHISEAMLREVARWGSIGNHQDTISFIKDWLALRIPWMTSHLGSYSACENVTTPPLVISRINYHPGTTLTFLDADKLEFLEITNAGNSNIDLTGIYFGGTGLVYQFPAGSSLPAGTAITLASDSTTFLARYGMTPFGQFYRNLSNADENIVLSDAFGNEIDHVHYYDVLPWPDADGNGRFLQLISDTLDNSLASSWIAIGDSTQGLDHLAIAPFIQVYPNPANASITIGAPAQAIVEISNIEGQIIKRLKIKDNITNIDISNFAGGVYIIRAQTDKGITTKKFIKE